MHHQQQQQQQPYCYPYPQPPQPPQPYMNTNMPPPNQQQQQFPVLNPIPQPQPTGKRRRAQFEATTPTPSSYDYHYFYYHYNYNTPTTTTTAATPYYYYDEQQLLVDGDESISHVSKRRPNNNNNNKSHPDDVIFRIVVPSKQIGKVIGKEGSRIQKIRESTKATIKIADAIARHEERVIIISSKERDNAVSDAENALQQIAALILKEDESSLEAAKLAHVAANTIRLLIAGTQAGSLIGVSGQNIEKLRDSSGATITVLAPNQLPLCASALESDRVVQISGDVPAVMKALEEIGSQLRENPPRQVISISPAYNYCAVRPTHTYVDPASVDYVTLEMLISETLVGGLIGRCGSNISRIRSESGATIKVHGGKGAQKHRQIQFGGSAQQVALAKQRVDEYIYSQLTQQEDSDQGVDK